MTTEAIAEAALTCAEFKVWRWHRDGFTLFEIRAKLIEEDAQHALSVRLQCIAKGQANTGQDFKHRPMSVSTIHRYLKTIEAKILAARLHADEGETVVRIAVDQENFWTGNTAGNPTLSDTIRNERHREMLARRKAE